MGYERAEAGYRHPHYGDGDRLRIVRQGQYFGEECVVEGEPTRIALPQGYVLAYLYRVRLDDGTVLDLAEELIAPLPE